MAVRTGVVSSASPGKALYDLIAVDLAANPNWSRPVDPTLTGGTDSYTANYTTQVWKCTVGSSSWHLAFSYDDITPLAEMRITGAEKYGAADGLTAKTFSRIFGGGTVSTATDTTSVTPGATDVVTNVSTSLPSTSPNFSYSKVTLITGAMPYLFKVGNKDLTIGVLVGSLNKWVKIGAFESLVTGPSDPMPIGMFTHGINNLASFGGTFGAGAHSEGVVARNPGLGVAVEQGAFYAMLAPLHLPIPGVSNTPVGWNQSARGFGAPVPRWYTKTLMSQAVIHQSQAGTASAAQQTFRGYYSDLFACIVHGATEPSGGGADTVVIDGVTYYWLGMNCPGVGATGMVSGSSVLVAVRAD